MLQRIKKQSNMSHMEIMHLINEARESDFDLEQEIDWKYDTYATAKNRIQHKTTMRGYYAKENL